MIKDCVEDLLLLKNTRRPEQFQQTDPTKTSFTKNMGAGIPTVEDIVHASNLYYGPLKPSHFIAWTCSA